MIIGVSLDRAEPEMLNAFAKRHDMRFPIGLDTQREAAQKYGVRGTPTSYLISSDGVVVGGASGPRPWDSENAKKIIKQLLNGTPSITNRK